jgi:APA family basic amino acid/polyamine antiporter
MAIILQGICAAAIAFSGKYDQILNYVVAIDVLFFGLTGASLLIFRAHLQSEASDHERLRVPWHPVTTGLFVLACWAISISTIFQFPRNAGIGVGILAVGALVYPLWRRVPLQ